MRTSDVTQLMDLALGLWFPFVRIMAFLRYMPVLDNSALTARVRIILSLALAIIITPLIPHPIPHDLLSLNSLILTVEQILWGMLFGLMFQFLFLALQLAGQILSFNMGMSMAVMNDPSSGASTTVLAELINVYAILLFFAMDGHLLLVSVLYKGFTYWPIGNALHPQTLRTIALAFSWVLASASLLALPFKLAMNEGLSLYASVMRNFVILFIFFALLDVPLAKALFTKGLKMTKQELKEEYKNQEGKPEVKARVRRLQRQLAMGQIRKVVPKANVVITNPTHYAVALQYDSSRAAAPFVVAKGTDEIALYIRQVATENQVEVVEFPRLARSVYYTTQVNQQIPFQLYRAIAHVLTYVLQMKHWREGAQPRPALNRHISIPKEVLKLDGENN
ncbi:EscU/YscU/HrcU family type III secretion system export apparatus switch protein [Escherichia coli]